ncbi:MAG: orange carotenoid protein N-terminal domain-containing protein [Cyanobacteria bacterium J06560_2]
MVTSSESSTKTNVPSDIAQGLTAFEALSTDEKLGYLWVLYDNMGGSITPAAPGASGEQFTQNLLNEVKGMEEDAQMAFMRDLVEQKNTEQCKAYSTFSDDSKLAFWYELAEEMAAGNVIPVPDDYEMSGAVSQVFNQTTTLDFNQQITLLRYAVIEMGA